MKVRIGFGLGTQVATDDPAEFAALVDGLEGRKSLELISALYESIETGQEVPLHFAPRLCRLGQMA